MHTRPNNQGEPESDQRGSPAAFEDARWVQEVLDGMTGSYGQLVRKYQDRVFNTCWRICGDLEDARDLAQEAFLRAFERLDSFGGRSSFYTWLFRVAVNLALSHRRKARLRNMASLDAPSGEAGDGEPLVSRLPAGDAADPVESGEVQRLLVVALKKLDADYRAVVVLRDMEGLDYQEISEVLEIPVGTVKSRLFRARSALREAVAAHLPTDE